MTLKFPNRPTDGSLQTGPIERYRHHLLPAASSWCRHQAQRHRVQSGEWNSIESCRKTHYDQILQGGTGAATFSLTDPKAEPGLVREEGFREDILVIGCCLFCFRNKKMACCCCLFFFCFLNKKTAALALAERICFCSDRICFDLAHVEVTQSQSVPDLNETDR